MNDTREILKLLAKLIAQANDIRWLTAFIKLVHIAILYLLYCATFHTLIAIHQHNQSNDNCIVKGTAKLFCNTNRPEPGVINLKQNEKLHKD